MDPERLQARVSTEAPENAKPSTPEPHSVSVTNSNDNDDPVARLPQNTENHRPSPEMSSIVEGTPYWARTTVCDRNNILTRVAAQFHVQDKIYMLPETMEFHWPERDAHLEALAKNGTLDRIRREVFHEGDARRERLKEERLKDPEDSDSESKMETPPESEDEDEGDCLLKSGLVDPELAARIVQMLREVEHKSQVWEQLESYFKLAKYSGGPTFECVEGILWDIRPQLILPMDCVLAPEGNTNSSGEFDGIIRLMLHATGVVSEYESFTIEYSKHWQRLSEAIKRAAPDAYEALLVIYKFRKHNIEILGPQMASRVRTIANSACITKQRALYDDIMALIYEKFEA